MNVTFIEHRQNLQKVMMKSFRKELQTLNTELQGILVNDMITAFFNRLRVMEKIQDKNQKGSI